MDTIPALTRRRAAELFGDDTGAATAEYAITTMATLARSRHVLAPRLGMFGGGVDIT